MEENPKQHDFDQRHDGPLQTPSGQEETDEVRWQETGEANRLEQSQSAADAVLSPANSAPTPGPIRHIGTQWSKPEETPRRKSTQITRNTRASRDFDRRTDGPFGRPSLAMTRRQSSNFTLPASPPVQSPLDGGEQGHQPGDHPPPVDSFQSSDPAFEVEPPPLNYSLRTRKLSISIFWGLILFDSIAMPIALYFPLWYATDLSHNTVFSIVTAALGGISILEYFVRFWRLWKKGSNCRVIGARRMYLDWFHWNFTAAWLIIMIELIVGSVPEEPYRLLVSMPLATMLYTFGTQLLIIDTMRYFQVPAPVRISSIPKGAQLRPGIYSIIEDIIAVDGSGGTEFREALNRRYEASHVFRAMLRRLGMAWAVGAQATAVLTTILIFTLQVDVAYCIGWSLPFVWAGIWTAWTIWYVRKKLREEKVSWAEEAAAKSNA